jgi:hypothetical protein
VALKIMAPALATNAAFRKRFVRMITGLEPKL